MLSNPSRPPHAPASFTPCAVDLNIIAFAIALAYPISSRHPPGHTHGDNVFGAMVVLGPKSFRTISGAGITSRSKLSTGTIQ